MGTETLEGGKDRRPGGDADPLTFADAREEARAAEAARRVTRRAVRRLDALEMALLVAAVFLALAGGAVAGWLLRAAVGLPFRWGWAAASLLFFLVPGAVAYWRTARAEKGGAQGRRLRRSKEN